ncbi:hypothetical protein BRADI_1g01691v3 [Brachypodium distachyon]|uniref:Uncharacterized protein n=1 Tax=Brachypodium distachyon TaxID=15368 RepID=A0A0Q3GLS9_BRADI|nr:hypothetical protein BRADI_1g01691v3 [Brachypodium distachyon]
MCAHTGAPVVRGGRENDAVAGFRGEGGHRWRDIGIWPAVVRKRQQAPEFESTGKGGARWWRSSTQRKSMLLDTNRDRETAAGGRQGEAARGAARGGELKLEAARGEETRARLGQGG